MCGLRISLWISFISVILTVPYVTAQAGCPIPCYASQFHCDSCECVHRSYVCDSQRDCSDGSDEISTRANCSTPSGACAANEFRCTNKRCIPHAKLCDQQRDCTDGSDEMHCGYYQCAPHQWACPDTGRCIALSNVCDGTRHCDDGSDERTSCSQVECSALNCEHKCVTTPSGGQCDCQPGYRVDPSNGRLCIDYDECSGVGACDQNCTNAVGSYRCSCSPGFQLVDGTKCTSSTGGSAEIYFTQKEGIFRMNVGSIPAKILSFQDEDQVYTAAVHLKANQLYFADIYNGKIYRYNLTTSGPRVQLPVYGLRAPVFLAVDWLHDNLYVSDDIGRRVEMIQLNNQARHVNVISDNVGNLQGIGVDPLRRFLFVADAGYEDKDQAIWRSSLDGSSLVKIISKDMRQPSGLDVDLYSQRVYWTDRKLDYIHSCDYNGRNRAVVLSSSLLLPNPEGVRVFESSIYYNDYTSMNISVMSKFGGKDSIRTERQDTASLIRGTYLVHPLLQPYTSFTSFNKCPSAGCSHMCVTTARPENNGALMAQCVCSSGFTLAADGKTCKALDEYILFSTNSQLRGIPLRDPQGLYRDAIDPAPITPGAVSITTLDVDVERSMVYYYENRLDGLYRFKPGSGVAPVAVLAHGTRTVAGLAFDWIGQNIYYSEFYYDIIGVAKLEPDASVYTTRKELLEVQGSPRALAVHPRRGYLYFTTTLRTNTLTPYIGRASMDGTGFRKIISTGLAWPNALSIDYARDSVYWADAYYNKLEMADYNGQNRVVLLKGAGVVHPYSMVVHQDYLYITDWRQGLVRINKTNSGGTHKVLRSGFRQGLGVTVMSRDRQRPEPSHPCQQVENGQCSHFCFSVPKDEPNAGALPSQRVCGCPDGMLLGQDSKTCSPDPSHTPTQCLFGYFGCANGRCVLERRRCDGVNDCLDGSDEPSNCTAPTCSAQEFQCEDKSRCIRSSWRCDSEWDCRDFSDEKGCPNQQCKEGYFRCNNGLCIPQRFVCNTENECFDGSDEGSHCAAHTCPSGEFQCPSSLTCLSNILVCDGDKDCPDGADELGCPVVNCTSYEFRCASGQCIHSDFHCDHINDCDDNSDEKNCPRVVVGVCSDTEFKCGSGECVRLNYKCDGLNDCADKSDENECGTSTCPEHKCESGECITNAMLCDGDMDCKDGSDESPKRDCKRPPVICHVDEWQCVAAKNNPLCVPLNATCDNTPHCDDNSDEGGLCGVPFNCSQCAQTCVRTPTGARCTCRPGYEIVPFSPNACRDVNECAPPSLCDQTCVNTLGSYKCSCQEGFTLIGDHHTCLANDRASARLLVADRVQVVSTNVDGTSVVLLPLHNVTDVNALAVDVRLRRFFWFNEDDIKIFSANVDGTDLQVVVSAGIRLVEDLEVDYVTQTLYFTDYVTEHIEAVRYDGSARTVLVKDNTTAPRGLALDPRPEHRLAFFSDWLDNSRIERMNMDGSDRRIIVDTQIFWPNDITIDYTTNTLYYVDSRLDYLASVNYEGSNHRFLLKNDHFLLHPISLVVFEQYVYFTDRQYNEIRRCTKHSCTDRQTVVRGFQRAWMMQLFHSSAQPQVAATDNPCLKAGCSHLCLLAPGSPGYSCRCPTMMRLKADGKACETDDSELLLILARGAAVGLRFDDKDTEGFDGIVHAYDFRNGTDIDYDYENQTLFWSVYDENNKTAEIQSQQLDGSNRTVYREAVFTRTPRAILVDYLGENMYWADPERGAIGVMRMDDPDLAFRKLIMQRGTGNSHGVGSPVALAMDATNGTLYWLDEGSTGVPRKIGSATMHGLNPRTLVTSRLQKLKHLTVNRRTQMLYWTHGDRVECYDLAADRRCGSPLASGILPTGVTVRESTNTLYYADMGGGKLYMLDLSLDSPAPVVMRQGLANIQALRIYTPRPVRGEVSPCSNLRCAQLCVLAARDTAKCACESGYQLDVDGRNCTAINELLVVATRTELEGIDITPTASGVLEQALPPIAGKEDTFERVEVDVAAGQLIWASEESDDQPVTINMIGRRGANKEPLVTHGIGNRGVYGMAYDWTAGNLYFSHRSGNHYFVEVLRVVTKQRMVLFSATGQPMGDMAINPQKRYLYYAKIGPDPQIARSYLDFTGETVIVNTAINYPYDLTLDPDTGDLYFCDIRRQNIQRVDADGGQRVYLQVNLAQVISVAVDGPYLYWADHTANKVFRSSKDKDATATVLRHSLADLNHLAVWNASGATNQPHVENGCNRASQNYGGCEQLCLAGDPSAGESLCKCAYGVLAANGKNCTVGNEYLIYATQTSISSVFMYSQQGRPFPPITNLSLTVGLDVDVKNNDVYFTEVTGRRISRVNIRERKVQVLADNANATTDASHSVVSPDGIAYDWVSGGIYWVDSAVNRVLYMRADRSHRTTLALVERPRALQIQPCKGYLYWTDWGRQPKIERASMAGSGRRAVVSSRLGWPNGLTVDYDQDLLYWADALTKTIERSTLDGSNREVVVASVGHPFSLTLFRQHIFWSDWIFSGIFRADKETGAGVTSLLEGSPDRPMDVKVFSFERQKCTENPCVTNNASCSHGCHPSNSPSGFECSCPDNLKLANGNLMCVSRTATCTPDQFTCVSGFCLSQEYVCDLDTDCADGSDENPVFCANHRCPSTWFTCGNGRCVPMDRVCDLDDDCRDNSDEEGCETPTCAGGAFTCANGRCLDRALLCDGVDDCKDDRRSDELHCNSTHTCADGLVPCTSSTQCLLHRWLCDGEADCSGGEDELATFCNAHECPRGDFKCKNGRCIQGNWVCDTEDDCGDNSDEEGQGCGSSDFTCPVGWFTCDNKDCVSEYYVCDGEIDCTDGSDESTARQCGSITCHPDDHFTCESNRAVSRNPCIRASYVCDGEDDCNGGEDERNCTVTCNRLQRPCDNGVCVFNAFWCDHVADCSDQSDEKNCSHIQCKDDEWPCATGNCIKKTLKCDSFRDCFDGSDESEQTCEPPVPCLSEQFKCPSGSCLNSSQLCDGIKDCDDNADEEKCGIDECALPSSNQCEHDCKDLPVGFRCTCPTGYRLSNNSKTCDDINECEEQPWNCTQHCYNLRGSYKCDCDPGYALTNGAVCKSTSDITPYLVFANRFYLRNLSLDGRRYDQVQEGLGNAVTLDFDWKEQRLYFADLARFRIQRLFFNGTALETIQFRGVIAPEGIALDWVGRKLYWTDLYLEGVHVSELNGSNSRALITRGVYNPRALSLDPARGLLFYTDWQPMFSSINRCGMDGEGCAQIVGSDHIVWPNSVTADTVSQRVWFCDAHLNFIAYVNYDGTGLRNFFTSERISHPFSVSIWEEWVFWSDWNHHSIEKANRFSGKDHSVLLNVTHRPNDLHVVHPLLQKPAPNPCGANNGGCTHLCLLSARSGTPGVTGNVTQNFRCACPDDYLLQADGKSCVHNCSETEFRCQTNDRCIPQHWVCDASDDCHDGSDEPADCPARHCPRGQFQCLTGKDCTSTLNLCDGTANCPDGSDESNTTCKHCMAWQFQCTDKSCVYRSERCDGVNDCPDGSDEQGCESLTCDTDSFRCNTGQCIPKSWVCDVDNDCGDNSDEAAAFNCSARTCTPGFFKCRTNYRCVGEWTRCDGDNDCRDWSDERSGCPACHPSAEFRCASGQCIPKRWLCNFREDCTDGSDETNATCAARYRSCSESEFRCNNQRCVPRDFTCDGEDDCGDNSDEHAACPSELQCRSGLSRCANARSCYSPLYACDGVRDCSDGSDESGCSPRYPNGRFCPANQFQCANKVCVSPDWVCDGDDDCGDHSDESFEQCREKECDTQTHFRCGLSGACLTMSKVCDGTRNCPDGSDENQLHLCGGRRACNASEYRCANSGCVEPRRVCDRSNDCGDESDERGCHGSASCGANRGGCEHSCTDLSRGGYVCTCHPGYIQSPTDPKLCVDVDECSNFPNNCTQLCTNTKGSYGCTCASGFVPGPQSCAAPAPDPVLLYVTGGDIRSYNVRTRIYGPPVQHGRRVEQLDYLPGSDLIYYLDSGSNALLRARMATNASSLGLPQVLIGSLGQPFGLAVDYIGRNLYFSERSYSRISVCDLYGRFRRALIQVPEPYYYPADVAVNPQRGLLYFTVVGAANPRIEWSWLTGSNRAVLISKELGFPTAVTSDPWSHGRLYWADSKLNRIETANWDGTRRAVVAKGGALVADAPWRLDIFESALYYTSQKLGHVGQIDKRGHGVDVPIVNRLVSASSVRVYHPLRYNTGGADVCERAGCHHLCLLRPDSDGAQAQCFCREGSSLVGDVCDGVSEPMLPTPQLLVCAHGGLPQASGGCVCPTGYSGPTCDGTLPPVTAQPSTGTRPSYRTALLIVMVIIAVILLAMVVGLVFYCYRRRGTKAMAEIGGVSYHNGDVDMTGVTAGAPAYPAGAGPVQGQPTAFDNPYYGQGGAGASPEAAAEAKPDPSLALQEEATMQLARRPANGYDPAPDTRVDTAPLVKADGKVADPALVTLQDEAQAEAGSNV